MVFFPLCQIKQSSANLKVSKSLSSVLLQRYKSGDAENAERI